MTESAVAVSSKPAAGRDSPNVVISEEAVDKTRAWTGLYVVVGSDVAIMATVVIALFKFADTTVDASTAVLAAILASAFSAIGTMTTAYFGIRASSSTAQRAVKHRPPASGG
jgi:hypothetical protein